MRAADSELWACAGRLVHCNNAVRCKIEQAQAREHAAEAEGQAKEAAAAEKAKEKQTVSLCDRQESGFMRQYAAA